MKKKNCSLTDFDKFYYNFTKPKVKYVTVFMAFLNSLVNLTVKLILNPSSVYQSAAVLIIVHLRLENRLRLFLCPSFSDAVSVGHWPHYHLLI